MRIQSPLTDGTIYSSVRDRNKGRSRDPLKGNSKNSPTRRLTRMVIMLVLVLVLMREAADPSVYRNFFAALGAPLAAEPMQPEPHQTATIIGLPEVNESNSTGQTDPPQWLLKPATFDSLVAELGRDGRKRVTSWLAEVRRSRIVDPTAHLAIDSDVLAMIASAAAVSLDKEEINAPDVTAVLASANPSAEQATLLESLQAALDREYLSRVSDATIWTKDDADAFYRWLEIARAGKLDSQGLPVFVGFVSLLDQPAVYRGTRVAIPGKVVRVEPHQAIANPFGIDQYWLVWLRPEDGSERPVMGFISDLPAGLGDVPSTGILTAGPQILLDGVFLRRHLYQSEKGSELAPVIVGRVKVTEPQTQSLVESSSEEQTNANNGRSTLGSQLLKLTGIAAVIGVAFSLFVAGYTSKTSRWRRDLRQRGLTQGLDMTAFEHAALKKSTSG